MRPHPVPRTVAAVASVFAVSLAALPLPDVASGKEPKPRKSIATAKVLSGNTAPAPLKPVDPYGPLPVPVRPVNIIPLSPAEQLGKNLLFDTTLSNPRGYACATCHIPATGFTGPSSAVNEGLGPVPGVVAGRFGRRKPQAINYAAFSPTGPVFNADLQVWLGGNFWDGRAPDLAGQARMPFLDPNEMNNPAIGPLPPHSGGYSSLVAHNVRFGPFFRLFEDVFGPAALLLATDAEVYTMVTRAIAAYESSAEVNPFSSRYDASQFGVPPANGYRLSPSEANGLALFFGRAQCFQCHSSATLVPVLNATGGKNTFTMYCYANIGVPKNQNNPFYHQTSAQADPLGYNPLGASFIDFGLGANPNPAPSGGLFMHRVPGDIPQFRGLFKAPSLRNVDKRPSASFVKSYMHNGVFKSLQDVVHFYNKRNIAVDALGNESAFDLRTGPPAGSTPLFPPPEVLDNVQNVAGVTPENAGDDVATNGQVGNLSLSDDEEADVVSFLKILTDGYTRPNPIDAP
ncbi:MAG: cytochrome c peroxidase [Isosphaeraceae bacterium]|nr:cytochrome c peroxidase [Isosphaeraceae bacterium]